MDCDSYENADALSYQEYIFLHVGLPEIVTTKRNNGTAKHTIYNITLKTNSISFTNPQTHVRRRYSDFVWLKKRLRSIADLNQVVPILPRKQFVFWNFNKEFLESRRQKLQDFLRRVVLETIFLSSSALHLFLQTELSPDEMELSIESGKVNDAITHYMNSTNTNEKPDHESIKNSHEDTAASDAQKHNTPVLWKVKRNTLCKISSMTKITTLNGNYARTGMDKKYSSESDLKKFNKCLANNCDNNAEW